MKNENIFDVLIVVTPADCERVLPLYPRLVENFDYGNLCFIGAPKVGEIARNSAIREHAKWVDENDIIPFDDVHKCMASRLSCILGDEPLPRGVTGWYYQQFLKMQYSYICEDEYYMVWDGDTVPCRKINMFSPETGQPYLDLKHEYHPEYFETMGKLLPGFGKVIERSFISEHMLFRCDIMRGLIADIEKNNSIPGEKFWEKIINAIEPEKMGDSSFSEFETYGTYVALRHPSVYKLREWHSFRLGGSFFEMDKICDRDFEWLGRDFDAISFEKGQSVREDNKGYFDNPEVQKKISAKKLLQAAQMEYKDGYKEVWEDDITLSSGANVRVGGYNQSQGDENRTLIVIISYNSCHLMEKNLESIRDTLTPGTYKVVVVDNASTDGVTDYLARQEDIIFIRNDENVGFGPACNMAVKATVGTEFENYDVFLLNNDTRLVFDALYFLRKALCQADDIGAVGAVSNYAGNKQQLDVTFDRVEDYISFGEKNNVPMENPCLERVRLSGFAMLIRRKVWDEIGGFDEDFAPGYFEDDALSMEILKRGYRLELVRNSFIYHAGSQSFINTDYERLLEEHHNLFVQKYGFDILKYAYASGTVISQIPYSSNERFTVLHYGCGLGAELKAIRSIYPNSECYGIETNSKLETIARKTEQVFANIGEMLEFITMPIFGVLIIDKDAFEKMDEAEKNILLGLLLPGAAVIIKNEMLETYPYDKIKLIIWDMDDTFWQGILSEGEVILPLSNAELIKNITDHGVVNSISSKNDEAPVIEELEKAGVADLFVFNNINWEEKGAQIADKITAMGLRAENVLFIDDNPRNLEEARYHAKEIMTASPDIIPYLTTYYARTRALDTKHDRLAKYKLLEKKTKAQVNSTSKEAFLKESDIRIVISRNCLDKLDRISELVMRSNQLNYTKNRDDKSYLMRLITNDWNDCAYIEARDRFGDYGIIGFYCYNTREKKMEHFLFSCRVLGMGIEQYIYNLLGCPEFEIKAPVSVALEKNKVIDYITEEENKKITEDSSKKGKVRILLKGPCDLDSIEPYLSGASITSEFNYINDKGFITTGQNHSMHIWQSANLPQEDIEKIIADVPFITEGDFLTKLFDEEYHVICFSMLTDLVEGLYKRKNKDEYIAFANINQILTLPENKEGFISGELQNHGFQFTEELLDRFSNEWEFIGNTPIELLFRNLDYIYDHVKGKPLFILLLGSEVDYEGSSAEFDGLGEVYREFNPVLEEFAADHERMKVINITKYINSQDDYVDSINHFSRNVYYKIAGEIAQYINELV